MEQVEKSYVESRDEIKATQKPHAPQKKSIKLEMINGETYYYCTCGLSKN